MWEGGEGEGFWDVLFEEDERVGDDIVGGDAGGEALFDLVDDESVRELVWYEVMQCKNIMVLENALRDYLQNPLIPAQKKATSQFYGNKRYIFESYVTVLVCYNFVVT